MSNFTNPWADPFTGPVHASGQGLAGPGSVNTDTDTGADDTSSPDPKVSLLNDTANDPTATPADREAARLENARIVAGLGIVSSALGQAGQITVAALNNASHERIAAINNATTMALANLRNQAASQGGVLTVDQASQQSSLLAFQSALAQLQSQRDSDKNTLMYVGLGVAGLAAIGLGLYAFSGRKSSARHNPVVGHGRNRHWVKSKSKSKRRAR